MENVNPPQNKSKRASFQSNPTEMKSKSRMRSAHQRMLSQLNHSTEKGRHLVGLQLDDDPSEVRGVTFRGKNLINFGSCSYFGLEKDERLIEASCLAAQQYGVQFSSSTSFMRIGAYHELEELLQKIFATEQLIVSQSVTHGHLATIPIVVDDFDLVLVDKKVHASVKLALDLLTKRNIPIHTIDHNAFEQLESFVVQNHNYRRIWFFTDGVFSMLGDRLPVSRLEKLKSHYENLHLYIDDSHGMSFMGERGQGFIHSTIQDKSRCIIVTSNNKCFAGAGGTVCFADEEDWLNVKRWGSTLMFGGPLQPPQIASSIASAKIHLSPEIAQLQMSLLKSMDLFHEIFADYQIKLENYDCTPLHYLRIGDDLKTAHLMEHLLEHGLYVNLARFPAVSYGETGLRITTTVQHCSSDFEQLARGIVKFIL